MTTRILNIKEVCYRTGLSKATIYRRLKDPDKYGYFPPPLRLGKNRIGWLSSTIDEFMNNLRPDPKPERDPEPELEPDAD